MSTTAMALAILAALTIIDVWLIIKRTQDK